MSDRKIYAVLFGLLGLAYLGGLFLPIMEVDAAQYAAMSMEMLKSHSFLKLYDAGSPYLDKPPLLIWLSSLSFYLFGISGFAYRLPSFLGTVFGVYCTYQLARQWYSAKVAQWSALILASCQAFFLFNHDVKTDNLLTSMVIFAIWQLSSYTRTRKIANLMFGALGLGLAMLAKGPIGLMVPIAAIGAHLLLQRNWKMIFNVRWLLALPVMALVLSPMLYGLYEQWGWHGIRFYFWTQSFGRITGESGWQNDSGLFFFVHTYAWAFLPWTVCGLAGLFFGIHELLASRFRLAINQEGITLSGFVLMFVALSASHYKLPHYIFVLFPLLAIFTARWLLEANAQKWLRWVQVFVYVALGVGTALLLGLVFQPVAVVLLVVCTALLVYAVVLGCIGSNAFWHTVVPGVICMAAVNMGLNYGFYPRLMQYQPSDKVGTEIAQSKFKGRTYPIPENRFYFFNLSGSHSLDFYSRRIVKQIYGTQALEDTLKKRDIYLYVDEEDYPKLSNFKLAPRYFLDLRSKNEYDKFTVQNMSLQFLNPATRTSVLGHTYLLHLAKTEGDK